jgi:hypothetical protein
MVTIKTLTKGYLCLTSRVAASPSISGIRTSINSKSGCSREHSRRASRPLAASPTTSISGSSRSMSLRPSRARSWSSIMASRVLPGVLLPMDFSFPIACASRTYYERPTRDPGEPTAPVYFLGGSICHIYNMTYFRPRREFFRALGSPSDPMQEGLHCAARLRETVAATEVPASARLWISSVPPSALTRSCIPTRPTRSPGPLSSGCALGSNPRP